MSSVNSKKKYFSNFKSPQPKASKSGNKKKNRLRSQANRIYWNFFMKMNPLYYANYGQYVYIFFYHFLRMQFIQFSNNFYGHCFLERSECAIYPAIVATIYSERYTSDFMMRTHTSRTLQIRCWHYVLWFLMWLTKRAYNQQFSTWTKRKHSM